MATFNYYLGSARNGKSNIILYVHWSGLNLQYSIGLNLNPNDWHKQRRNVRRSDPDWSTKNEKLDDYKAKAQKAYRKFETLHDNRQPSKVELKDLLDENIKNKGQRNNLDLVSFVNQYIETSITRVNPNKDHQHLSELTIKKMRTNLSRMIEFTEAQRIRLDFDKITDGFYDDYVAFLTGKGYRPNTIGKYVEGLKHFMGAAEKRGIDVPSSYKEFKAFKELGEGVALTEDELQGLEELELVGRLDRARDLFLVGCYSALRFSDYSTLTTENFVTKDGQMFIIKKQLKTRNTVTMPVDKKLMKLLKKYDYALPELSNQKLNEYIKEVAAMVPALQRIERRTLTKGGEEITIEEPKWKKITTHCGRRTWATLMYNKNKNRFPLSVLMAGTGHKTEKQFYDYIRVRPDELAKDLVKLQLARQ